MKLYPLLKNVLTMASSNQNILVVAAHPDDESLGCAGTIARHTIRGDNVYVVFLADGISARLGAANVDFKMRARGAKGALEILGVRDFFNFGFPDNQCDSVPLLHVVQKLEEILAKVKPCLVYTHHGGDLNIDHQVASKAVQTACRPHPLQSVKSILSFEILSATDWNFLNDYKFNPNFFVDITETFWLKKKALAVYDSEIMSAPHSRSFENIDLLSRHRGMTVGVERAEAFSLCRHTGLL